MLTTMKKYTAWLLALSAPFLFTGCKLLGGKDEAPAEEMTLEVPEEALDPKFESVEYGFRVQGPEGWVKAEDSLGMLVTYVKPGDPTTFQENISLAREPKGDLGLVEYATRTIRQLEEFFPDHKILLQTQTTVKKEPAAQLRYQINAENLSLTAEQFVIERPTEYLLVTYMANSEAFESSYAGVQSVLDSLIFVGPDKVEEAG